jgi:hypothetical protein
MLNGLDTIEGLTPEQEAQINKLAQGLADKNTDLLGKVNTGKEKASGTVAELERLRILEQGLEQSKLEEAENYKGALTLKEQQYNADLEKLTNGSNEKDQLIHKLLVENGLSAELVKLNVNPDLMGLIQQGLSATATVTDGQAMIGDKSLSEYMKEWGDTPQGKASRVAPGNSGGDALGGTGVPAGKKMADMSGVERTALLQQNPTEFNRLKAEMQSRT